MFFHVFSILRFLKIIFSCSLFLFVSFFLILFFHVSCFFVVFRVFALLSRSNRCFPFPLSVFSFSFFFLRVENDHISDMR